MDWSVVCLILNTFFIVHSSTKVTDSFQKIKDDLLDYLLDL